MRNMRGMTNAFYRLDDFLYIKKGDTRATGVSHTHMRRHVSVPESQRSPVKVKDEGGIMLSKARNERGGQCGGQLQVLVSKQQRSNCGIHTEQAGHRKQNHHWSFHTNHDS